MVNIDDINLTLQPGQAEAAKPIAIDLAFRNDITVIIDQSLYISTFKSKPMRFL